MKRSNRLIILIGVFLAMIAFVGVVVLGSKGGSTSNAPGPTATAEPPVTVVVAKTDIKLGDKITNDNVRTVSMTRAQKENLGPNTFSDVGEVLGLTVSSNIAQGAYLYKDRNFAETGSVIAGQDIAPAVAAGMRAIAVDVDAVNGVGTLIVPGDHVDVVLSVYSPQIGLQNVTGGNGKFGLTIDSSKDVTTKLIIQNRKVLAVLAPKPTETAPQAQTPANPNPSASATPAATDNSVWYTQNHVVVILEVKPEETEVIRWAQRAEGKQDGWNNLTLGLTLRSDQDNNTADAKTQGITFRQLTVIYNVLPPDPRGIIPSDILAKITW